MGRSGLFLAMAERIFTRLAPHDSRLEELTSVPLTDAAMEYAVYVTERLLHNRHLAAALIEQRLEAVRAEDVRAVLTPFLRGGFEADVRFHQERKLPGGREDVLRLHHLINGVILDATTIPSIPIDPPWMKCAKQSANSFGMPKAAGPQLTPPVSASSQSNGGVDASTSGTACGWRLVA